MKVAVSLFAGLLFGIGLAMSGMLDPARVLGFLDFAGDWDPSLAFVLGGAVAVSGAGTLAMRRMPRPLLAEAFDLPTKRRIDGRLLIGASLFGLGWGLAGFCPGPALAALSLGLPKAFAFAAAMLAGMWCFRMFDARVRRRNGLTAVAETVR